MNHEQKRPDATKEYHEHGPHLIIHWKNVPKSWKDQYTEDRRSYTGSAFDGPGDPFSGYAAYDFESIMHYPSGGRFETVPTGAKSLTGQRHRLSQGDIIQILDQYQCREAGANTETTTTTTTTQPPPSLYTPHPGKNCGQCYKPEDNQVLVVAGAPLTTETTRGSAWEVCGAICK